MKNPPGGPDVLFLAPPRWYAAHATMRTLAAWRVHVYALRHDSLSPSNLSRYCAGTFRAGCNGRPVGDPEAILRDLTAAGRRLGEGTVLLCGSDEWAVFVAEHECQLAEVFVFPRQPAGLVASLASKQGLYQVATSQKFPTPKLLVPRDRSEAMSHLERLEYPVMLKPLESRPEVSAKAVAQGPDELRALYFELEESPDSPNVIFQEYIPGGDENVWMFAAYFDGNSRCLAGFTGQKVRQLPMGMGHTSLGITRHNAELIELATRFLSAVGYRGVVDSGYRFDPRDGQFKVLDINPRIGGNFRQFVDRSGTLDVVRAAYLDLTGHPIPAVEPLDGRKWLKEDSDLVAFAQYRRNTGYGFRQWFGSLRKVSETALFSWRDPLPFLAAMALLASDTVTGRVRRRLSRFAQGRAAHPALGGLPMEK